VFRFPVCFVLMSAFLVFVHRFPHVQLHILDLIVPVHGLAIYFRPAELLDAAMSEKSNLPYQI
jgi:hypothetical protein